MSDRERMRIGRELVIGSAVAAIVTSCGTPARTPPGTAASLADLRRRPPCIDAADLHERLVIDWSPLDRAKLESAARRSVILVRVRGCNAEIADECATRGRYEYSPTSRQREVMTLRDGGAVSATLPLVAARFGASMERSAELDVTMTVVGRYESGSAVISEGDLQGRCEGVTHAVASLSVGSFEIFTASKVGLAGFAEVVLGGAHARSSAERRHLDSAGVPARCAEARRSDASPPEECGVPLRLELRRIGAAAAPPPPAPPLPPDELARVMAAAKTEVAPCYRRALAEDATFGGSLTLTLTVAPTGNVRSVAAKHDVADELAGCAVRAMQRLSFPTGEAEAPRVFVVPFVFNGARASPSAAR